MHSPYPHRLLYVLRILWRLSAVILVVAIAYRLRFPARNLDEELITSIRLNDVQKVRTLLQQGADPNALVSNELEIDTRSVWSRVKYWWTGHPSEAEALPYRSVLSLAIKQHNADISQALLSSGANVNKGYFQSSPLLQAIVMDDTDIANILLRHNADTNLRDRDGKGILEWDLSDEMRSLLIRHMKQHNP